jgi:hypothetical protein
MVNLKDVKRDRKNVVMSIRTTEEISRFMKKHGISPSLVFHRAIENIRTENFK